MGSFASYLTDGFSYLTTAFTFVVGQPLLLGPIVAALAAGIAAIIIGIVR